MIDEDFRQRLQKAIDNNTAEGFLKNRMREGVKLEEIPREWLPADLDMSQFDLVALRLVDDAAKRSAAKRDAEFKTLHRLKRRAGLAKVAKSAELLGWQRPLVLELLEEYEQREIDNREWRKQAAEFEAKKTAARDLYSNMTLRALVANKPTDDDLYPLWATAVKRLTTTVARMAAELNVSESTVRASLDRQAITPCMVGQYTIGSHGSRKDVTAYHYDPDARELVCRELTCRAAEREKAKNETAERNRVANDANPYLRDSGFLPATGV